MGAGHQDEFGQLKLTDQQGQQSDAGQFMLHLVRSLGLRVLLIDFGDVAGVEHLPFHHRDPFDRLLVVQTKRNDLPIVSADPIFERYGVKRVW